MKFHWGHGIALFYLIFVGVLIFALVKSFGVDHSLVVDDYYAKDLTYQEHFDKKKNYLLSDNVEVSYDKDTQKLMLAIDGMPISKGSIWFYRASEKDKDFNVSFNTNKFDINTANMISGRWKLKIEWTQEGNPYYTEKEIYI